MSANRQAVWLLAAVTILTALPFLNRPYFVDDYYHVVMAKGLLDHPLRPYDFRTNDAGRDNLGWEAGQLPRMVNPPLFHYYLAGVMKVAGSSEIILRTSMLPFSFLALLAMFFLGKRFSPEPLGAALLMALTPAYWLTSYSLLIDGMLIGLVLSGLWAFFAAHERRSVPLALLAGLLLGLAMLTKYFGVLGIVLAFLWQVMNEDRRRWWPGWGAFVVFAFFQLGWAGWTMAEYGQPHFWATLPRGMTSTGLFFMDKLLITASFFGGGTVFALIGYGLLWRRSRQGFFALMLLMLAAALLFRSAQGGFDRFQSGQLILWMGATVAFIMTVLFWQHDEVLDEHSRFLLIWLGLGFFELIVVMPWTAGRYFLCLLPATCWLVTRIIPRLHWHGWGTGLVALTGCLGLMVASADYLQANVIRELARTLIVSSPTPRYYLGDTFSGYEPYLKPLGWEPAFPTQEFKKGDILLIPRYRQSLWWNLPPALRLEPLEAYQFQSSLMIRVMDIPGSAGWYASVWGSLPWVVTRDPLERFELYRVL